VTFGKRGEYMNKKFYSVIAVMLAVCLLILTWMSYAQNTNAYTSGSLSGQHETAYTKKVFNKNKVIDIYITISESDLNDMFENAEKEEYKKADVVIDGERIGNVGIRTKGNSSLRTVASSDSNRYSFKIDFNQYNKGQSFLGLTKLNLNNCMSDASYMREYLSYYLFDQMGVPTPAFCFTNIYINGELHGLYLAVEGMEEPFVERYYGSDYGILYKPVGENGAGADLVYIDDNPESYSGLEAVTDAKEGSDEALVEMIKALNEGRDLDKYLDIDEILRYFAVNTTIVSMDSYQGQFAHNYYLYEEKGKFSILPWDYNMSFGGFMSGGGSSSTSLYIDQPVSGTTLEDRPLIGKLLEVPEYKELYHKYIQEFINGPFSLENMKKLIKETADMIRPYVEKDPTKFVTIEQFEQAVSEVTSSTERTTDNTNGTLQDSTSEIQSESATKSTSAIANGIANTQQEGVTDQDGTSVQESGTSINNTQKSVSNNTSAYDNDVMLPDGTNLQNGGMMPPDGMQMPDGNNMPVFGGGMMSPDGTDFQYGGMMPPGGMQIPDGNTMPAFGRRMVPPDAATSSDKSDTQSGKQDSVTDSSKSADSRVDEKGNGNTDSSGSASNDSNTSTADDNAKKRSVMNFSGMRKQGGDPMMSGNSTPLLSFISERIDNVTKQLSGELPTTGTDTDTQESLRMGKWRNFSNNKQQDEQSTVEQDQNNDSQQDSQDDVRKDIPVRGQRGFNNSNFAQDGKAALQKEDSSGMQQNDQNGTQQDVPNMNQNPEQTTDGQNDMWNMIPDIRGGNMQPPGKGGNFNPEAENMILKSNIDKTISIQELFTIGGAVVLLLAATFIIFKKKTKYTI